MRSNAGRRSPRPLDRALAFLDPLLACSALVVEGDDILGGAYHVRHDEADARIKFARMPFDLLLTRPIGRPPNEVRRSYANFTYQAMAEVAR
jgi:hypothetical protein